jgi:hypothetical protein
MSAPNGEYVPSWLSALGVKSGEYFIDSKPRARRAMKSEFFSPAARIHICLGLATMGFQQELAVKMEAGKRVPLTPADVCRQTGISRQHFRRHMAELEAYGLAECRGSAKGRIAMYSWALPREVQKEKIVTARGDNLEVVCEDGEPVSESLLPILKHFRIRLGDGKIVIARGDIAELERLAQVTKEGELSLRAFAEGLRARQPLIRKKETAINIERNERTVQRQSEATPEVPTTESMPVRSPVISSPSKVREKLRTWLSSHAERFGLLTAPDNIVLDQIAVHITDEATFARFARQVSIQRPQPNSWMYFVSIARACAEAHAAAAEAALTAVDGRKTAWPPGVAEALSVRIGDGSLTSFRAITGNPAATFEEMDNARQELFQEVARSARHATVAKGDAS